MLLYASEDLVYLMGNAYGIKDLSGLSIRLKLKGEDFFVVLGPVAQLPNLRQFAHKILVLVKVTWYVNEQLIPPIL